MKPLPLLPSLLCALGLGLVAVAAAQEPPPGPPGPPPHGLRFEQAVDECLVDAGEDPADPDALDDLDDAMGAELMDLCMADKGFDRPPPAPPRGDGPPPPPRD